jgi:uncharacterized protein affecting Mg2+/Co2+ transport
METVEGPGVVGETPILERLSMEEEALTDVWTGIPTSLLFAAHREVFEKLFSYTSSTSFQSERGVMKGSFRMIPGSAAAPAGEAFEAEVAPFLCQYLEEERLRYGEW